MILFVGHDANLTGAPKSLLIIIKYFKSKGIKPVVILGCGGPLIDQYKLLGKTFIWNGKNNNKISKLLIICEIIKNKPKLIFNNTIANGAIIKRLSFLNIPVISRIAELESVIRWYNICQNKTCLITFNKSYNFIAPSKAVKDNLVKNHGISSNRISVCYGSVPCFTGVQSVDKNNIRNKLGLPKNSFIIGACGTPGWVKGTDLFIKIAHELINKREIRSLYFVWLGGSKQSRAFVEYEYEIEKLNLKDKVILPGLKENVNEYYSSFDVFLMTSREDPFPLVNIEAAFYGLPIICFKNSGGSQEFIRNDFGFAVDYLDIEAMAEKILQLREDKELYMRFSANAQKRSKDFCSEEYLEKIYEFVKRTIK
jgi:glycosyltransferase involved in cell wall biosynthesis